MRKLAILAGGALMMSGSLATADILGVGASVSYWDSDLTGQAEKNNDLVDVENDLNLSSDGNVNVEAYFEHPVPLLPNVRLNYTRIEQSGDGNLSAEFDGLTIGTSVRSDLELTQLDGTLYYELLDNWVNLDAGLTVRSIDGELLVQDTAGGQQVFTEISGAFPMAYAAARFDLPFTGVSVGAQGNLISYDGDSISDFNAYGQYELSLLQLRAGYRRMSIDYEDDNNRLDVELGGPFISAGLSF
jgi:outer membrane protein